MCRILVCYLRIISYHILMDISVKVHGLITIFGSNLLILIDFMSQNNDNYFESVF